VLHVGRLLVSVSRAGGQTVSAPGSNEQDVEAALVVLLAPVYVNGVGCGEDLAQVMQLVSETGADIDAANDRTRRLVAHPAYRRTFWMIERALMSRPVLSGDDVAVLLAP
jgi:hypothetical protein